MNWSRGFQPWPLSQPPILFKRIIERAIPGLILRHLEVLPVSIPQRLNFEYFELVQSGANWEAIQKYRAIAIRVPAEIPSPQLELLLAR